jgi:hypothetical protein
VSAVVIDPLRRRVNYYRRIFAAYLTPQQSQLTFWHEHPAINGRFEPGVLGEYYMPFTEKANYPGAYDGAGIPLLNYHGVIGLQYNPIAVAQFGLGNYNLYRATHDPERRARYLAASEWLVHNLEENDKGIPVWHHKFDWESRNLLRAPWYSALAQGQGISLLVRAHSDTGDTRYLSAARRAFVSFTSSLEEGGVTCIDGEGNTWFEEIIVDPPTHTLNGFIWAAWGVYDYALHTGDGTARKLFDEAINTLLNNLPSFDIGFWSLYEHSGTRMKMIASHFYHNLHIVQLQVMYLLSGRDLFNHFAETWDGYRKRRLNRTTSLLYKSLFKMIYY